MALVEAVNTAQVQAAYDDWARQFLEMTERAKQLVAFRAEITPANATAGMLLGNDGAAMPPALITELGSRYGALQNFVTWAETGGASSPVNYLRATKRAV